VTTAATFSPPEPGPSASGSPSLGAAVDVTQRRERAADDYRRAYGHGGCVHEEEIGVPLGVGPRRRATAARPISHHVIPNPKETNMTTAIANPAGKLLHLRSDAGLALLGPGDVYRFLVTGAAPRSPAGAAAT
jgi:hypothetical protein